VDFQKARPGGIPVGEGLDWHLMAQQRARASRGSSSTTGQHSVRTEQSVNCGRTHIGYPVHHARTELRQLTTGAQLTEKLGQERSQPLTAYMVSDLPTRPQHGHVLRPIHRWATVTHWQRYP